MSKEQKTREPTLEDNNIPALAISIKGIVGSGKDGCELAMATHVAGDLSESEINKMLDKMTSCMNRQRVVCDIPFLNEQIAHCEKSIESVTAGIIAFDKIREEHWNNQNKGGKVKLKQAEETKRNQQLIDLDGWQKDLETYQGKLMQAQAILGGPGEVEQERAVRSA